MAPCAPSTILLCFHCQEFTGMQPEQPKKKMKFSSLKDVILENFTTKCGRFLMKHQLWSQGKVNHE